MKENEYAYPKRKLTRNLIKRYILFANSLLITENQPLTFKQLKHMKTVHSSAYLTTTIGRANFPSSKSSSTIKQQQSPFLLIQV